MKRRACHGLRERLVKVKDAPGRSFDHGEFEIVVESAQGRVAGRIAANAESGPHPRPLRFGRACRRFVRVDDRDDCAFYGTISTPRKPSTRRTWRRCGEPRKRGADALAGRG
ncbi:MAG TPA: hypothetical protein VGQ21_04030 [Thermoanaerobaculia bacterium]|jgi:hypothetical protein|nr:hypothetical protein [Thermoanaerobaculia bacterium]